MPENESLIYDAKTASRWQPLSDRMDGGQMPNDMFGDIQDSFYLLCGKVWRRWKRFGVDPSQLFDAALNDPKNALPDLIKRVSYDGSAQLLRDVAAELPEADMEELMRRFFNAAWEDAEGQLQLNRRDEARSPEFIEQVNEMLNRIVTSLLNNPSRFPNRPSRNEPPPDLDLMLGQNLL